VGIHQGIPSPPSSPPLAALTSANELALISKNMQRGKEGRRKSRREGSSIAYTIREECERLFCETMKTVFLGAEGRAASNGSIVMGANAHSPPSDGDAYDSYFANGSKSNQIDAWIEVWDYISGCSFRAFVGGNGENKSLFVFFDQPVVGHDLKQGLMALIELAETVFAVSQLVICLDRTIPESDSKAFMKSLRWVGFELITLDMWVKDVDVTSKRWLYLGMEV